MVKQERQKRLKGFPRKSEGNGALMSIETLVASAVGYKKRGGRVHVVRVHACQAVNLQ